jgi:cytochrome c peroxidase
MGITMRYFLWMILSASFLIAEPITPLPMTITIDKDKAALGKALFFDPILSKDGTISCASCHNISEGGDDGLKVSVGIDGKVGSINAPTVLNAVYNFRQFWDGRAKDLKAQAAGPIENPIEMGNSFENLIKTLKNSEYKQRFSLLYQEGITKDTICDAIAEYEKGLVTYNSPFDRYLRGDKEAISQKQKEGYALFQTKGCIACHHGINVGGNMYNKFGIIIADNDSNLGRYNVTHNESDKYFFKVPSLRNVAETAPYFHNGSVKTLKEAVYFMAKHQLGRLITEAEVEKIVLFLESLSGTVVE